jgi:hypothetical protein
MRMRKSILVTLSAVFILLTGMISCNKKGLGPDDGCEPSPFKKTSLKYIQTQCADVWGYGNTDSATIKMAYRYLDSLGLLDQTSWFTINNDIAQLNNCTSCTCASGKLIWLINSTELLDSVRIQRLRQLGFR